MIENILNLKGVKVLSKKEQLDLVGGLQTCILSMVMENGDLHMMSFDNYSDGALGSAQAEYDCASAASGNAERCWYDCEYDGFGQ